MSDSPLPAAQGSTEAGDAAQLLVTLFELGREVTSVLDLDELLEKIPQLIARLTPFKAFAVWLLDEKRQDLGIAYAVGYPEEVKRTFRLAVGQGIVGTVVGEGRSLVIDDVLTDPRYIGAMTDVRSQIAVPLRRKKRVIGALNLYGEHVGQFTPRDEAMLRQFGAHVAVAIENARLFEREKAYIDTLETLAEIGREVAAILDLEQLLERVATLVHKVVSYRTFGIFLLDERRGLLEQKLAIRYGDHAGFPHLKLGEGLIGHAAADKKVINVPDVTRDPRYLPWVEDCRSELAVPLLVKDRCIGVMDLESPDLRRLRQARRRGADGARQPGGGRDRERAAVRGASRQRGSHRARAAVRTPRAGGAAAGGAAQANARRGRGRALHAGARAGRRPARLPVAGVQQPRRGRWRRLGQGRAGGALQRVCGRTGPLADVQAPLHARAVQPGWRVDVDQHDPVRAAARRLLLHALLRVLRSQAPHADDGQLRAALCAQEHGGQLPAD